jgi:hypothetical protein
MVTLMHLLTRGVFPVDFEWRRLAHVTLILAGVAVSGELLLPTSGPVGLVLRILWLALIPALLLVTRFITPAERAQARALASDARSRVAAFRAGHGDVESYAEGGGPRRALAPPGPTVHVRSGGGPHAALPSPPMKRLSRQDERL